MSTYKQIGSAVTVGAGGAATISFTSIPNTYTDLVIKISGSDNRSGQPLDDIKIRVNSNTSAIYTVKRIAAFPSVGIYSDGAGPNSDAAVGWVNGPTATANTFANTEIYLPNYASNVTKTGSIDGVTENNAAISGLVMNVLIIDTTSPISSIQLSPFSTAATAFNQYTTAYLYGISNA
jgi:hypothetical protein